MTSPFTVPMMMANAAAAAISTTSRTGFFSASKDGARIAFSVGASATSTDLAVTTFEQASRAYLGVRSSDAIETLTRAGRALVPRLAALADANDEHFFGHLGAAERQALRAAMQALVQHHGLKDVPTD